MFELEKIAPFVRRVQLKQDKFLSGQWQDFSHVLTYVASGTAIFLIDGKEYFLQKGDILLRPPYAHLIITSDCTRGLFTQYSIHFDMIKLPDRTKLPYRDTWNDPEPKVIPFTERIMEGKTLMFSASSDQQHMIRQLFPIMYAEYNRKDIGYQEILKGFLLYFLVLIYRNYDDKSSSDLAIKKSLPSKAWKHISVAMDFIGNNFSDPNLSNDAIANATGITSIYLTQAFKRYLGLSLHQYLLNFRIEQAKNLLSDNCHSVTEVSVLTGFSSIQAFSKSFRAIVGLAPTEYANAHVSKNFDFFSSKK